MQQAQSHVIFENSKYIAVNFTGKNLKFWVFTPCGIIRPTFPKKCCLHHLEHRILFGCTLMYWLWPQQVYLSHIIDKLYSLILFNTGPSGHTV
jgi:hypothetical protein